jgi:hypothetical protein
MTQIEQAAVIALMGVGTGKHPWAGKRILELQHRLVASPERRMEPEEAADLWYLAWHFRAQISDAAVVAEADSILHGATHLFPPRRE